MNTPNLLTGLRRAVNDYKLIRGGDRVAVGLSGGKDSLTLLKLLAEYRCFSPEKFELAAITVDLGFNGEAGDFTPLNEFCRSLGVRYIVERSEIGRIVFDVRKEENPCSLCAKLRKGALCGVAKDNGFNKVALGHHADDFIETMLLSLFYEGRLSTMPPKRLLDRTGIVLIRPMLYLEERNIAAYARNLPVCKNKCPADKHSKRMLVKETIDRIKKDIPFVRDRMYTALMHPERYCLFDKFVAEKNDF